MLHIILLHLAKSSVCSIQPGGIMFAYHTLRINKTDSIPQLNPFLIDFFVLAVRLYFANRDSTRIIQFAFKSFSTPSPAIFTPIFPLSLIPR